MLKLNLIDLLNILLNTMHATMKEIITRCGIDLGFDFRDILVYIYSLGHRKLIVFNKYQYLISHLVISCSIDFLFF